MLEITERAVEISNEIDKSFDNEYVIDCIGAVIVSLTNQIIIHGQEPDVIRAGTKECLETLLHVIEGFIQTHDETDPVWHKLKKNKEKTDAYYHAAPKTMQ